jgi:hypothetical protein
MLVIIANNDSTTTVTPTPTAKFIMRRADAAMRSSTVNPLSGDIHIFVSSVNIDLSRSRT